jgi:hypothetical protein
MLVISSHTEQVHPNPLLNNRNYESTSTSLKGLVTLQLHYNIDNYKMIIDQLIYYKERDTSEMYIYSYCPDFY